MASTKRHPFTMRYRTAATQGRQDPRPGHADIIGDAGAYPCLSARVLFAGAALATGPYRVPARADPVPRGIHQQRADSAFRGFGAMQVVFGVRVPDGRAGRKTAASARSRSATATTSRRATSLSAR